MASKNEEYIAVVSVLIALVILSIFFGILWSFLLVFTFLLLAYLFGRPQTKGKIVSKKFKIKDDLVDNSLNKSEYVSPGKEMDVPFTGLPSPKYQKQSLRSPMPLLSSFATVTKRLSFNTSTLSPHDGLMFGSRSQIFNTTLGSPRQSPMSPIKSAQTPKYFSLINPALNQPSTVKIATPEVNANTLAINKSQKLTDSPLSRATILSALKKSTIRKRSVLEDEDGIDDASSPIQNHKKKRRYHYPIVTDDSKPKPRDDSLDLDITRKNISGPPAVTRKSSGIYSLIQTRLKRKPLHDDGYIITPEEGGVVKRTRQEYDKPARPLQVIANTESSYEGNEIATTEEQITTLTTTTISSGSKRVKANNSYDDDNDSGCDADDDEDIVMKTVPIARGVLSSAGAGRLSKKQALRLAEQSKEKRKRTEAKTASSPPQTPEKTVSTGKQSSTPNHTPDPMVSRQQRISKKQRFPNTPAVSEVTTNATDSPSVSEKSEISGQEMSPKKRFTVVRFPSKKDESKRRPVPVYCASINSPDVPKRRPVTHTITKEDIELDRKLAWQRVQSLLDGSDEDEEEKSKGGSPSVAIHVTTCMPSPSKSQTKTVTTTSGILSSSSAVSDGCKESQETVAVTTLPPTASIQPITITPNIASTRPSTSLSTISANKPSGITIQPTTLKQTESSSTPLTGTTETKPTMLLKGAITTLSDAALSIGKPSLTSTSLTPNTQGFSFNPASSIINTTSTVAVTQVDAPSGISTAPTNASVKSLFGASTSQAFSPKSSITSLTTSSQSSQNPICTPVVQTSLGSKIINTVPSVCAAPGSFSINFASTTSIPPKVGVGSSSRVGANTSNNPLQAGFKTSSNPLQVGFSIPSSLPKSTSSTPSSGPTAATISSSLFSGFTSSTGSVPQNTTNIKTQQSQAGFSAPGGFSFSGSTIPKTTTQASTFNFGANQQTAAPNAFGSQTSQSMFAAGTVSTQNTLTTNTGSTQSAFGASLNSTGKPFGSSNPANLFGASSTTTAATSTPAFGLTSTNSNAFGNTGSAGSTSGFKFGGNTPSTNVFGNATQPSMVSSAPSGQFSFGSSNAPEAQIKSGFSFAAGANSSLSSPAFGTATSSQGTFGSGTTKNVFGATVTPTPFGASASQNVFGSSATNVPIAQTSQNAFGGLTNQNAFGSPATQNVFQNPAGTGGTGGFSFGGAASSTPSAGGFKFGAGGSNGFQSTPSQSAPTFGTTTSAPQPTAGGFNFSAGGTTNTPAFGATTATPGGFKFGTAAQTPSSAVAKPRPKIAATRRRTRK